MPSMSPAAITLPKLGFTNCIVIGFFVRPVPIVGNDIREINTFWGIDVL